MAAIEVNKKAKTVKKISGKCIETIPFGIEFIVTWTGGGHGL
jgi:hypothetical protein